MALTHLNTDVALTDARVTGSDEQTAKCRGGETQKRLLLWPIYNTSQ